MVAVQVGEEHGVEHHRQHAGGGQAHEHAAPGVDEQARRSGLHQRGGSGPVRVGERAAGPQRRDATLMWTLLWSSVGGLAQEVGAEGQGGGDRRRPFDDGGEVPDGDDGAVDRRRFTERPQQRADLVGDDDRLDLGEGGGGRQRSSSVERLACWARRAPDRRRG